MNGQLLGRGAARWEAGAEGGRCAVTLWNWPIGATVGDSAAMQATLTAGIVAGGGGIGGLGVVIGSGSSQLDLPDMVSRFVAENGLVLVEEGAVESTLRDLRIIDLLGRAEAAGIPGQALDLEALREGWVPFRIEGRDGAADPAAPDPAGPRESLEGPGEGGG